MSKKQHYCQFAAYLALVLCVGGLVLCSPSHAQVRAVALSDTDPQTQPDEYFDRFQPPKLNDSGHVSFTAELQNTLGTLAFTNNYGVWTDTDSALRNVARLDLVPMAAPVFGPCSRDAVHIINDGTTLFDASPAVFTMDGNSYTCQRPGLWADDQGVLTNVLDRSIPLDGTNGVLSSAEFRHDINNAGQFVFESNPAGFGRGVWFGDQQGTRLIVSTGSVMPAINNEVRTFEFAPSGKNYLINEQGAVAVRGLAFSPSLQQPINREGIWLDDGALQLVAMAGGSIDGAPNGPVFQTDTFPDTFSQLQLSDDGVFFAGLAQRGMGGVTADNDEALYFFQNGGLRTIVREGDPAPGTNTSFGGFVTFTESAVNRTGDMAFVANIDPFDRGVWVERDGQLDLVLDGLPSMRDVAVNDGRQVAFVSSIGLMAERRDGQLVTVAAYGEPFEVAPGDFRTPIQIGFAGNEGFNERGQIAFLADFDDGTSGIFVSNAVAIPEPWLCGCWTVALTALSARRFLFVHTSGRT